MRTDETKRHAAAHTARVTTFVLACATFAWAAAATWPAPHKPAVRPDKQARGRANQRSKPAFRWTWADEEALVTRIEVARFHRNAAWQVVIAT